MDVKCGHIARINARHLELKIAGTQMAREP